MNYLFKLCLHSTNSLVNKSPFLNFELISSFVSSSVKDFLTGSYFKR